MSDGSRDDPEPVGPRVRAKAERVHLGSGAFAVRPRGARAPPAGRSRPRARLRRRTRQRVLRELRRSEEHTSELQSPCNLVCRLLLEKKKKEEAAKHLHSD